MPDSPRACSRCRQPLGEGTSYCVTCGCTNDAAYAKLIANENQIAERRLWLKFWTAFANMTLLSRLFR